MPTSHFSGWGGRPNRSEKTASTVAASPKTACLIHHNKGIKHHAQKSRQATVCAVEVAGSQACHQILLVRKQDDMQQRGCQSQW